MGFQIKSHWISEAAFCLAVGIICSLKVIDEAGGMHRRTHDPHRRYGEHVQLDHQRKTETLWGE